MIIMVLLLLHITMMILFSTPQKVPLGVQTCVLNTQRGVIITKRGVIILLQFSITGVIRQCCGVVIFIGFLRWSSLASCFENILLLHYRVPKCRITPRFLKHVRNLRGGGRDATPRQARPIHRHDSSFVPSPSIGRQATYLHSADLLSALCADAIQWVLRRGKLDLYITMMILLPLQSNGCYASLGAVVCH